MWQPREDGHHLSADRHPTLSAARRSADCQLDSHTVAVACLWWRATLCGGLGQPLATDPARAACCRCHTVPCLAPGFRGVAPAANLACSWRGPCGMQAAVAAAAAEAAAAVATLRLNLAAVLALRIRERRRWGHSRQEVARNPEAAAAQAHLRELVGTALQGCSTPKSPGRVQVVLVRPPQPRLPPLDGRARQGGPGHLHGRGADPAQGEALQLPLLDDRGW